MYFALWKKELPSKLGTKVSNTVSQDIDGLRGLQISFLLRLSPIVFEGIAPDWMVSLFRAMAEVNYQRTLMSMTLSENNELRELIHSM